MKKYLTILQEDLSEIKVAEPESEVGFTYADYLTWNFKERIELIRGKIVKMSPAPSVTHQNILINISGEFSSSLRKHPAKYLLPPLM